MTQGSPIFKIRDPDNRVRALVEEFIVELDHARPGATHAVQDVLHELVRLAVADPGIRHRLGLPQRMSGGEPSTLPPPLQLGFNRRRTGRMRR